MDIELKERLDLIDGQIQEQKTIYSLLTDQEPYGKSSGGDSNWHQSTVNREKEIFDKIHYLQEVKARLISGEKLPDVIYKDRETIKYIEKDVVNNNYNTSTSYKYGTVAQFSLGFFVGIASLLGVAWYYEIFKVNLGG